jgi:hypothetical protein
VRSARLTSPDVMLTAMNTRTIDTAIETRHIMARLPEHRRADHEQVWPAIRRNNIECAFESRAAAVVSVTGCRR